MKFIFFLLCMMMDLVLVIIMLLLLIEMIWILCLFKSIYWLNNFKDIISYDCVIILLFVKFKIKENKDKRGILLIEIWKVNNMLVLMILNL